MSVLSYRTVDRSRLYACVAFSASGAFLALVALLHVVKPDLHPDWHVLSEYAIGANGWIMSLAFLAWAVACTALAVSLKPHVTGRDGKVGIVLLGVAAFGLVLAAFATSDPVTATADELTTHGKVHGFGAMLGIPGVLLASTLVTWDLRRNAAWVDVHVWLARAATFAWASIAFYAIVMAATYDGAYGPDVKVGWANRVVAVAYCTWIMVTAAGAARVAGESVVGDAPAGSARALVETRP